MANSKKQAKRQAKRASRSIPDKPREQEPPTRRDEVVCSYRPGCECPYCSYHGYVKGPRQTYD